MKLNTLSKYAFLFVASCEAASSIDQSGILVDAAKEGKLDAVQEALKSGADIEDTGHDGISLKNIQNDI
jgi:hypothetical protein